MSKRPRIGAPARVVRSLHLPVALDRQIVRAARLSEESVMAFIRTAAESRAAAVIAERVEQAA